MNKISRDAKDSVERVRKIVVINSEGAVRAFIILFSVLAAAGWFVADLKTGNDISEYLAYIFAVLSGLMALLGSREVHAMDRSSFGREAGEVHSPTPKGTFTNLSAGVCLLLSFSFVVGYKSPAALPVAALFIILLIAIFGSCIAYILLLRVRRETWLGHCWNGFLAVCMTIGWALLPHVMRQ